MKTILLSIIFLLTCTCALADQEFVNLSESITMEQAHMFLKTIDKDKIKSNTEIYFPEVNKHPAHIAIDILQFNSAVSSKSRPVIRIKFKTLDNWERENDFIKFFANEIKNQLPESYRHNSQFLP